MLKHKLCSYIVFLGIFILPQIVNSDFKSAVRPLQICLDLSIDEQQVNDLTQQIASTLNNDGIEITWLKTCQNTKEAIWLTANYPLTSNKSLDVSKVQININIMNYNLMSDISPFLITEWDQTDYLVEYPSKNFEAIRLIVDSVAGVGLFTINQCSKAQEHFSNAQIAAAKSDFPTDNLQATIAFYQGNCAIRHKDFEVARDYFIRSTSLPSERIGPNYAPEMNLVWTYWKLSQTDKALQFLNKDIETIPNYLRPFHILKRAEFYVFLSRYADAIEDYNTVINQMPYVASIYLQRGQTYLLLYEWDNVLADYNKAIELDPTYADAYYFRGVLYYSILQTGQAMYNDALADFKHYLELAPDGEHAADATRYATDIQTQINALNN